MQIKEVSEHTGLSVKSIRFYEEKGLISVDRNADNSYRNYSQEDIIRLKEIRILRYLGLTVQEIAAFFSMNREDAEVMLLQLEQRTEGEIDERKRKLELIRTFRKDYRSSAYSIDEYSETIDLLSDEDLTELMRNIDCPSLTSSVFWSLMLLGPIFELFIRIASGKSSGTWLAAILALLSAASLVFIWQGYLAGRKAHKTYVKEKNRSSRYLYLLLPLSIVIAIFLVIFFGALQEHILAPDGWLFYQTPKWAETLMIWTVMLPVIYALTWLFQGNRPCTDGEVCPAGYRFALRYRHLLVPVWLICLYLFFISTTFVTQDTLTVRTPLHPSGHTYRLEEVQQVHAAYYRGGDFYYAVSVDGQEIVFSIDTANDEIARYEEDTYLWLEELDDRLMALGIPKTVDDTYASACDYNPQCIAHYRHICENLPQ